MVSLVVIFIKKEYVMSVDGMNYDNIFMRLLNRMGDAMILSLLFIAGCIPIVTIGASITATYYAAMKGIKGDDGYVFKNYIKSFKQNFKQATVIWLIIALLLFVFGVDLWFWLKQYKLVGSTISKVMIVISVGLLSVTVLMATYVFPLQSRFDNKTSVQLRNAFLLSVKNMPITLLLMVLTLVIGWLFYYQMALAVVGFVLFGFGGCAFIYAYFMLICFKPYLEISTEAKQVIDDADELEDEDENSEEYEADEEKLEETEEEAESEEIDEIEDTEEDTEVLEELS